MHKAIKQLLLATVDIWDPLWIRWYRLQTGEARPIPPFKNRDRVGARDIGWFFQSGEADALVFEEAVRKWADAEPTRKAVLDLGAGCGRILQYFSNKDFTNEGLDLAASDVDATAIDYVSRTFPEVEATVNGSRPPLSFPAERFDVVYAFSVWTHLPVALQFEWLDEAGRVLKSDGLLLLSTMGFQALSALREGGNPMELEWHTTTDADLEECGVIYHEYPIFNPDDELFTGISGSYGVAVHDPAYIKRAWSGRFDILEIQPGAFRGHQDLVVMRKI